MSLMPTSEQQARQVGFEEGLSIGIESGKEMFNLSEDHWRVLNKLRGKLIDFSIAKQITEDEEQILEVLN